jgi:hypothetical protein
LCSSSAALYTSVIVLLRERRASFLNSSIHSGPSQLRSVSPAKLGPSSGFMSEPFAERRARRHVFSPFNDASAFLADSPWPHPVYEDSHSVSQAWLTIDTFDPYHGRLFIQLPTDPNPFLPDPPRADSPNMGFGDRQSGRRHVKP